MLKRGRGWIEAKDRMFPEFTDTFLVKMVGACLVSNLRPTYKAPSILRIRRAVNDPLSF
jgi:hypothetical protein